MNNTDKKHRYVVKSNSGYMAFLGDSERAKFFTDFEKAIQYVNENIKPSDRFKFSYTQDEVKQFWEELNHNSKKNLSVVKKKGVIVSLKASVMRQKKEYCAQYSFQEFGLPGALRMAQEHRDKIKREYPCGYGKSL